MDSTKKLFLSTIIDDFIKIILFLPKGKYGTNINNRLIFDAKAEGSSAVSISIEGYVAYIFARVTKKRYPRTLEEATPSDIALVNDIWFSLGYPDKTFQLIGNGQSN